MALQTSGQITLQDIATEFGGTAPHGLTEYYAAAAGIPASGQISIQDFYGASANTGLITVTEGLNSYTTSGKFPSNYQANGYAINANELEHPLASFPVAAIGSISPATFNGVTIEALAYVEGGFYPAQFNVNMQGNRAKSFFTSVTPQGGNTLTTALSTHVYVSSGNYTSWYWADPAIGDTSVVGAGMPAQWNGTGTSTVQFT